MVNVKGYLKTTVGSVKFTFSFTQNTELFKEPFYIIPMHIQGYIQRHLFSFIKQSSQMLLIIILIDLIPLWGVLYWGWGTMDAVYLYFFETLIICFITYLKMRRSEKLIVISKHQPTSLENRLQLKSSIGKRGFGWLRWLLSVIFLLVNIPVCLILMMVMLYIDGKGFSFSAVFGYDGGHTDLFIMSVNTFYIIISLILIEHFYAYFKKFKGEKEYEYTGLLNEALAFEIRLVLQSIVMVGGIAMIFFFDFSKVMVIVLIILKTIMDVLVYLRNRYWSNFVQWVSKRTTSDELIIS